MPVYHFYRLVNAIDDACYIGMTRSELRKRLWGHRTASNKCSSKQLMEKYGQDNVAIVLIHSMEFATNEEAHREERRLVEEYRGRCVNLVIPYRSAEERKELGKVYDEAHKEETKARKKIWNEVHKEEQAEKKKAWHEAHKEETKERHKAWREAHKEETKERQKAWYEANKEEEKARKKAWRETHKEEEKARMKAWREANKEAINTRCREARAKAKANIPVPIIA